MTDREIVSLDSSTNQSMVSASGEGLRDLGPVYPAQWQVRPAAEESFISPRFVLRSLAQWWYVALPAGVLLAIISAAVVMLTFTPVYRASAMLKIASYTPYIAYTSNEQPMKPEEFTETQIELLRSPLVLEHLISRPEIAEIPEVLEQENPTAWLADSLRVEQVSNSELYNVSLDAKSPESSALLVNAIMEEYFEVRSQDEINQTKRVLELLDVEKTKMAGEIETLRNEIIELNRAASANDEFADAAPGDESSQMVLFNELRDKYTDANLERRLLEMRITALKETIAKDQVEVPRMDIELAVSESEDIQQLQLLIQRKKQLLYQTESVSPEGKNSRAYQRLQREIEGYERSMAAAAENTRPLIAESLQKSAAIRT